MVRRQRRHSAPHTGPSRLQPVRELGSRTSLRGPSTGRPQPLPSAPQPTHPGSAAPLHGHIPETQRVVTADVQSPIPVAPTPQLIHDLARSTGPLVSVNPTTRRPGPCGSPGAAPPASGEAVVVSGPGPSSGTFVGRYWLSGASKRSRRVCVIQLLRRGWRDVTDQSTPKTFRA